MQKEKNCKYCGEKIDKNSNKCLKCGKTQNKFFKKNKLFIIIATILILISIAIGMIIYGVNSIYKNSTSIEYSELDGILSDFWNKKSMTVDELVKEYQNDLESSELEYEYTYLEITGNIKNIEEDEDMLQIELKVDTESDYKVYCYFYKEENYNIYDELKNYKENTEITLVGSLERDKNYLNMEACVLGDWETYYSDDYIFEIDMDLNDLIKSIKENDKTISLDNTNIMSFSNILFDWDYNYEDILNNMAKISQGDIEITNIHEKSLLGKKTITMEINGEQVDIKVDDKDSIFDETLVYQINAVLTKNNSDKLFYIAVIEYDEYCDDEEYDEEYCETIINIAYSNEGDITKINKTLKKSNLDISNFKKDGEYKSI